MKKPKSNSRVNTVVSRKVLRQKKRQQKKINRQEHYSKKKISHDDRGVHEEYNPGKFVKLPKNISGIKSKITKLRPTFQELMTKERQKEEKETKKLKSQMEEGRRKILLEANDEEDKVIKKLEKQLGLNKTKNKTNLFTNDGLDYLLEICDRNTQEQVVAAEKHLANFEGESDFEEDLAVVTGKEIKDKKKKKKEKSNVNKMNTKHDMSDGSDVSDDDIYSDDRVDDNDDSDDDIGADENEKVEEIFVNNENKKKAGLPMKETKEPYKRNEYFDDDVPSNSDDEEHMTDDSHHTSDNDSVDMSDTEAKEQEVKPDIWEDIYGRKRDKEGNVLKEEKGAYVPPHLRDKDSSSDKELIQLKRELNSVLNKVSGSNLHWACGRVEAAYGAHSRRATNVTLCALWRAACVGQVRAPPRLLAEHAALVAVLAANVGADIGAFFLQDLVNRFDEMMKVEPPMENKELDNLVSALAYLYSFKIFESSLLYDILDRLLGADGGMEGTSEKRIDCVLAALSGAGGVLRRDDPAALKAFIHRTQGNLTAVSDTAAVGSRIKFLLEVLLAVKNNNLTKIPNYDPTYCEELKKSIRTIIRKGNYVTPLNIRLDDLLKADERGKWWVVGSAWQGDGGGRTEEKVTNKSTIVGYDQKLLELARKQRMNTDLRRTIFCIIMSAEDYTDAFAKLETVCGSGSGSGSGSVARREVSRVLLACCLQERAHNPYYAALAARLCQHHRTHQLSIQYTVWDKIKDLESLSKMAAANLAHFLTHLFMDGALPLSILKVIQFSDLNKSAVRLMRQILLAVIMNVDFEAALQVFRRVAVSPKLHMYRESLRLFIHHFLVRNAGKKASVLSDDDVTTLKQRALEVEKILTMNDSKLKF